jgi:hypothetical protein
MKDGSHMSYCISFFFLWTEQSRARASPSGDAGRRLERRGHPAAVRGGTARRRPSWRLARPRPSCRLRTGELAPGVGCRVVKLRPRERAPGEGLHGRTGDPRPRRETYRAGGQPDPGGAPPGRPSGRETSLGRAAGEGIATADAVRAEEREKRVREKNR